MIGARKKEAILTEIPWKVVNPSVVLTGSFNKLPSKAILPIIVPKDE
jgi:hypothetical protein